ncbi:MAG: sulfatase-like hydrolase/transferase [Pseudomonadota bacterium]
MKIYTLCLTLLVLFIAGCSPLQDNPQTLNQPNIILIMADDMGFETLGVNGSATYKTPNLDRLAANGIRFVHAHSQPLCTPSRVQIMTGRYNDRNYTHFTVLPKGEKTFAHIAKSAGYDTLVVGKWQLLGRETYWDGEGVTPSPEIKNSGQTPAEAGFDDSFLWQAHKERKEGERYADPLLEYHDGRVEKFSDKYGPDLFVDYMADFINARTNANKPFFIYYPMALPHDPFVPTPASQAWSDPENRYRQDNPFFIDMVEYVDHLVGRIISTLESSGLRDNTLVIFTTDNGTHSSIESHMKDGRIIKGGKGEPLDAGTHVPLIVSGPGVIEVGRASEALIDFTDFLPTITQVAGGPQPNKRIIDGQSFLPILNNTAQETRQWIYSFYDPRWGTLSKSRFARDRQYKLYDDGRFFDVKNDALETSPIAETALQGDAAMTYSKLQKVLKDMSQPSARARN